MSQTVHYVIIVHWIQDNEMLLHSRFRLLFSISFILTEAKRLEFRYLHSAVLTKMYIFKKGKHSYRARMFASSKFSEQKLFLLFFVKN